MRKTLTLFMTGFVLSTALLPAQSLAEAARKEAERRKALEEQGVQSKTIVRQGSPVRSAPTNSSPKSEISPSGKSPSATRYRVALEKLQGEILRAQERLDAVRKRLEVEKNAPLRIGRSANLAGDWQKLQAQVAEWESRLSRLKEERRKTYDEARKAGFLPGELDGRGITP
jgi:hypothetical protein